PTTRMSSVEGTLDDIRKYGAGRLLSEATRIPAASTQESFRPVQGWPGIGTYPDALSDAGDDFRLPTRGKARHQWREGAWPGALTSSGMSSTSTAISCRQLASRRISAALPGYCSPDTSRYAAVWLRASINAVLVMAHILSRLARRCDPRSNARRVGDDAERLPSNM